MCLCFLFCLSFSFPFVSSPALSQSVLSHAAVDMRTWTKFKPLGVRPGYKIGLEDDVESDKVSDDDRSAVTKDGNGESEDDDDDSNVKRGDEQPRSERRTTARQRAMEKSKQKKEELKLERIRQQSTPKQRREKAKDPESEAESSESGC